MCNETQDQVAQMMLVLKDKLTDGRRQWKRREKERAETNSARSEGEQVDTAPIRSVRTPNTPNPPSGVQALTVQRAMDKVHEMYRLQQIGESTKDYAERV
jgi:hypothetical protein